MKLLVYLTIGVATILLLVTSCTKDAADWTYSTDNTMSELAFDDVYNITSGGVNSNSDLRSCGTLDIDTTANSWFPVTLTFDYGTGVVCADGRTRSGVLTAVMSDRWSTTGMTCEISTTNYTVEGYQVEGTNTITNQGLINGNLTFKSEIVGGKVTTPDGDEITREATKYWSWIGGASTPLDVNDDVYQLTGTASGTTRNGDAFNAEITTPVVKAVSCDWVQEGKVEVTPAGGGVVRAIDYGSGTCDNQAEVSYGNWSMNITLN